jgi:hypothetical protein
VSLALLLGFVVRWQWQLDQAPWLGLLVGMIGAQFVPLRGACRGDERR